MFTSWELQALDEFFRSFGPCRDYCSDISNIGREIKVAVEARNIRKPVAADLGKGQKEK